MPAWCRRRYSSTSAEAQAWNGKNANLAFDFDDALLQLDDALLQLADPGLELLDELTECAILGLKTTVSEARSARRGRAGRA